MAARERLICRSDALVDSGDGVRFEVKQGDAAVPAFIVRYDGQVHAYLNRCAHLPRELDWKPGQGRSIKARLPSVSYRVGL